MFLSTGVKDLDDILEGGYPNPANIEFLGPSGIEKELLAYHFAAAEPERAYIVCSTASPQEVVSKASAYGINLSRMGFIDCYSEEQPTLKVIRVPGPSALNDLSLALVEAIRNGARRIVFDTLSAFILRNQLDSLNKFLTVIEGRFKQAGITALYLVDKGVHTSQTLSVIESGMDDVYNMEEDKHLLLLSLPGVEVKVPLKMTPEGLVVV